MLNTWSASEDVCVCVCGFVFYFQTYYYSSAWKINNALPVFFRAEAGFCRKKEKAVRRLKAFI